MHEQFPVEKIQRRRLLIPILKDVREKGLDSVLVDDKLFIVKGSFIPRQFVPHMRTHNKDPHNHQLIRDLNSHHLTNKLRYLYLYVSVWSA